MQSPLEPPVEGKPLNLSPMNPSPMNVGEQSMAFSPTDSPDLESADKQDNSQSKAPIFKVTIVFPASS